MGRMTRSSIKQESIDEPIDEHNSMQDDQQPSQAQLNMNSTSQATNGTFARAVSVSSIINTPAREDHVQSSGSGATTLADDDVQMNGVETNGGVNGASKTTGLRNLSLPYQLIQTIKDLENYDIDATLPSLTKFVVVGDQSAGKSSIIEAVCDITVPRDEGTCTRCPFQITTHAGDEWVCRIFLHDRYQYDPTALAGNDPDSYDFWTERAHMKRSDFKVIRDKSLLEDALRRAQRATLNPDYDAANFRSGPVGSGSTQVDFSPNVVSLEIEGPGLPELSFFDLPGAITVHEHGNDKLVDFVETLIKHYLRDDKALVLLACAANQDVDTSIAFRFVGKCEAKERCMGVFTKPDLAEKSRWPSIRQILNGERRGFVLGNGWYVTKQLSKDQLTSGELITHAQARALEQDFFGNLPWTSRPFAEFRERFGTEHLQDAISQLLVAQILHDLPEIEKRVRDSLKEVNNLLASFPEKPKHAAYEVLGESDTLTNLIIEHVNIKGANDEYRTKYKELLDWLEKQLRVIRPEVVMATPGYEQPVYSIDSDVEATPTKKRKADQGLAIRATPPAQRNQIQQTPRSARVKVEQDDRIDRTARVLKPTKLMLSLDEIRDLYDRGSGSNLPGQVNPKVTDQIIMKSVAQWPIIVNAFIKKFRKLTSDMLQACVEKSLAKRIKTKLSDTCKEFVERFSKEIADKECVHIRHVRDCETHAPNTRTDMAPQTDAIRTELQAKRLKERIEEHYNTLDANGVKVPQGADRQKKGAELMSSKADKYASEVDAMAQPLAYYDLASARMVDTIVSHLEYGLLHKIESDIRNALREALQVTDEKHCAELLAEDQDRENERRRLEAQQHNLQQALEKLESLPEEARSGQL